MDDFNGNFFGESRVPITSFLSPLSNAQYSSPSETSFLSPEVTSSSSPLQLENIAPVSLSSSQSNDIRSTLSSPSRMLRCRKCVGCQASRCGKCIFCKDSPHFGGSAIKKQSCILRKCRVLLENRLQKEAGTIRVRIGCKRCTECKAPDCEHCIICLDKKYFNSKYTHEGMCHKKKCHGINSKEMKLEELQSIKRPKKKAQRKPKTVVAEKRIPKPKKAPQKPPQKEEMPIAALPLIPSPGPEIEVLFVKKTTVPRFHPYQNIPKNEMKSYQAHANSESQNISTVEKVPSESVPTTLTILAPKKRRGRGRGKKNRNLGFIPNPESEEVRLIFDSPPPNLPPTISTTKTSIEQTSSPCPEVQVQRCHNVESVPIPISLPRPRPWHPNDRNQWHPKSKEYEKHKYGLSQPPLFPNINQVWHHQQHSLLQWNHSSPQQLGAAPTALIPFQHHHSESESTINLTSANPIEQQLRRELVHSSQCLPNGSLRMRFCYRQLQYFRCDKIVEVNSGVIDPFIPPSYAGQDEIILQSL